MKRTHILFIFVFAAALTMSGCTPKDAVLQNSDSSRPNGRGDRSASSTEQMNFGTPATVQDLTVGKKITVMGTTNADGTISATRIMIGEMPVFGPGFGSSTGRFASGTIPTVSGAPQNDPGQYQRRAGGEGQWGGQNGSARQRMGGAAGQTRVAGEIFKIDESSLVLKMSDGGSKIVFYSEKTGVFNIPTSTPPFNHDGASTTTPLPPPQP